MGDTPILEISRLEEIFEDDSAGIADLLESAMGTGAANQATLRDALGRHALEDVMKAAHAIKGSTANIGGTGYPAKLAGPAIPLFARIVAVADTFSALTSRRPWREAASVSIAVEQIEKESGFGFEPKIVGAFRDVMPELLDIRAEVPDLVPASFR